MNNTFEGSNVLVTGAAGFLGTNLIKRLSSLGANIRGTIYNKPPQFKVNGVEYVKADLTSEDSCKDVTNGIDYVIMAAANSSGAGVMEKTPLVHLTPNVVMNAQMLAAAYENKIKKFCFISSNTVYPLTDFAVSEGDVNYKYFEKYFIVGWMKRFSEIMCEMYSQRIKSPMATVVVRPGNLYGPYDKFTWKESKVMAALMRRAIERHNPFVVWGDGNDVKDFLYIDDFIDALLLTFDKINDHSTINIASGMPVTIREIMRAIQNITNIPDAIIEYDSNKPTMIPKRMINIDYLKTIVDWSPKTSLNQGIKNTIEWYQEYFKDSHPENLHEKI